MATQNRGVQIPITAKDETAAAVKSVESRLKGLEGKLLGIGKAASSVRSAFAGIAAVVSVGALSGVVKSSIDAMGALGDVANRTGVAREELQKLKYAAELSGVEFTTLEGALSKLNQQLGKARGGDKEANGLLKRLGIDPASAQTADVALMQLAERFQQLGDSPEALQAKAAALKSLKLDPSLLPLLEEGATGIKTLGEELVEMGGVIDDATVRSMEGLGDKLDQAKTKSAGLATIFTSGLEPALSDILDGFVKSAGGADTMKSAGKFLGDGLRGLVILIDQTATRLTNLATIMKGTGKTVVSQAENWFDAIGTTANVAWSTVTGDKQGAMVALMSGQARARERNDSLNASLDRDGANMRARTDAANERSRIMAGVADAKPASSPTTRRPSRATIDFSDPATAKKAGEDALKLAKAQAEAISKLKIDEEKRTQEKLKDLLEDGVITYQEYYDSLVDSQQRAIDARLDALRKEQAQAAKAGKLDEVAKLTAEITELERDRAEIAGKAAREQRKAEAELVKELESVEMKTKELLGTLTAADRGKILQEQYKKLREEAVRAGKSTDGIDELIRVETAKGEYDAISKRMSDTRSAGDAKINRIEAQRDAGLLTASDARRQIAEANREVAASIEATLPALREQAELLGGEYVVKIQEAETELIRLKTTADEIATTINNDVQTGLSDAIYGVVTGEKSPAQALKDLFKGVGNSIAKQVADDLAGDLYKQLKSSGFDIGKLFSGLFGGGGASWDLGGFGGAMQSGFGSLMSMFGFERGGYTGDVGTSQVAGAVHGKEYVLSAPAVRTLGVGFLDAFHSAARRGAPRTNLAGFADGGFARSSRGGLGSTTNVAMTVVTQNAQSFKNSQAQIEAAQGRALTRASRRSA